MRALIRVVCHPSAEELKAAGVEATNKKRHRDHSIADEKNTQRSDSTEERRKVGEQHRIDIKVRSRHKNVTYTLNMYVTFRS